MLADEPTSALDPVTASDVLNLLISLTRKQRAALLVASHDWQAVRRAGFKELHIKVDMGPSTPEKSTSKNQHNNPIRAVLQEASQEINEADSSYLLPDKPNEGPNGIAGGRSCEGCAIPNDLSNAHPNKEPAKKCNPYPARNKGKEQA